MENATVAIAQDAMPLGSVAEDNLTQLVNEESGVMGYIVSVSDANYLAPYSTGKEEIQNDLKKIAIYLPSHLQMATLMGRGQPLITT